MKLILEIPDNQADFMLELFRHFPFLKIKNGDEQYAQKEQILQDLSEAIDEVKLHKAGKIQLQSARAFLEEL